VTLILPEDRSGEETEILDRIRRGERVEHYETVRRRKDGRLINVALTVSPVRDEPGRIVGASHAARDITERKLMEHQLHHAQRLESLGVLAGGVAHDFNNLLCGILGNASLAVEALPRDHPAEPKLRDVIKASEASALLTRQLLAYAGKGKFLIERVHLSELTKESAASFMHPFPRTFSCGLTSLRDCPSLTPTPVNCSS